MWIPKWLRDRRKGVDSPAPTQVVSNEEFIPRPQNREQKQVEYLVGELAAVNSCKLGVKRRSFLRSSMGMAAYFWASNQVYGHHWEVGGSRALGAVSYGGALPQGRLLYL